MEANLAAQQLTRLWCNTGLTFRTHAPPAPEPVATAASSADGGASPSRPPSPEDEEVPQEEEEERYDLTSNPSLDRILGIKRGSKGTKTLVGAAEGAAHAVAATTATTTATSAATGRGKGRGRGRGRGRSKSGSQLASAIDKDGLLRARQLLGPLTTLGRSGVKEKWKHPPSGIRVVVHPGELGLDVKTIHRMGRAQEYNDVENRSRIVMEGVVQYRRKKEAEAAR